MSDFTGMQTALTAAFGLAVTYLVNFGSHARRNRTLSELEKRTGLVKTWYEIKEKKGAVTSEESARAQLEADYIIGEIERSRVRRKRFEVSYFRKFLLLYEVKTDLAKLFRSYAVGYLCLIPLGTAIKILALLRTPSHSLSRDWILLLPSLFNAHLWSYWLIVISLFTFGNYVETTRLRPHLWVKKNSKRS